MKEALPDDMLMVINKKNKTISKYTYSASMKGIIV
jgi:hypothetical protein